MVWSHICHVCILFLVPPPFLPFSFYSLFSYLLSPCSPSLCWVFFSVGISPKVLWKCPVLATYLNSVHNVLGEVSSFVMSMFLPPVLLHSICLALWWAGQWSRKCCTDSSPCRHAGQIGELLIPMQCRCLASRACPVHSCDKILPSFLGRPIMRWSMKWYCELPALSSSTVPWC